MTGSGHHIPSFSAHKGGEREIFVTLEIREALPRIVEYNKGYSK